jgi:hypothetical protein
LGRKATKPFLRLLKRPLPGPMGHLGDRNLRQNGAQQLLSCGNGSEGIAGSRG